VVGSGYRTSPPSGPLLTHSYLWVIDSHLDQYTKRESPPLYPRLSVAEILKDTANVR
jgi:hypothetical protein